MQPLALGHDRHAVVADGAAQNHHIARSGAVAGNLDTRWHHAHAGGVDEQLVSAAPVDHFGVARHNLHTRLPGRRRHRCHNALQFGQRQALLNDKAGAEPQWARTAHTHIVDRAADR